MPFATCSTRAHCASEPLFSFRAPGIAVRTGGKSHQPVAVGVVLPGQQPRIVRDQSPQALDVVVVNDASSLRGGPLQSVTQTLTDFGREALPAGVAVLARDHELRIALRQGHVNLRRLRARTCDGVRVASGGIAREFLCLFTKGLEGRTSRERLRSGHCDLLSSIACAPLKPG